MSEPLEQSTASHGYQPIVNVLLPFAFKGLLSYRIPEDKMIALGDYVRVPLGSRIVTGVAWEWPVSAPSIPLKTIVDRHPLPPMPELIRKFVIWTADYYAEFPGNVLAMCLRASRVFSPPKTHKVFRMASSLPEGLAFPSQHHALFTLLSSGHALTRKEIAKHIPLTSTTLSRLLARGLIEAIEQENIPCFHHATHPCKKPILTPQQRDAADYLLRQRAHQGFSATLLEGVTGSGKTEVYFEVMEAALSQGGQVLLLLPEIGLTLGLIQRVSERFGFTPALWHSRLSSQERAALWRSISMGTARLVLGARSALYLPWSHLTLIVVDEEHEQSFKQMDGVPYHGRDMAVALAALGKFPVLLASATPSLETWVNVDRKKYGHIALSNRYGKDTDLPQISLIDLKSTPLAKGNMISPPLQEAMIKTLHKEEQALLFLNRRGYAPLTLCKSCGYRIDCPHCTASLVEHRKQKIWLCHHCGYTKHPMPSCPSCHHENTWIAFGYGIEKLEEEVRALFPEVRMAVLSSDTTPSQDLFALLQDIKEEKYSLILGTQLIAKGHHFPMITLVGVLDGDYALGTTDPRAAERTWQTLTQVSGRAGRGEKKGQALIQTYQPEHPLMQAFVRSDRASFLDYEKRTRASAGMPPFGRLAAVIVSSKEANKAQEHAHELAKRIPRFDNLMILGPTPAPLALKDQWYRHRFLVKGDLPSDLAACLKTWIRAVPPPSSVKIHIDIDPYSFS